MIKKLLKWSVFFLLIGYVTGLCADQTIVDVFQPPAVADGTDSSISLLGQIFGSVDGVLHGAGTAVMGTMFGVYNAAVVSLGGIIILYTLMVSTLNTAHEGEYLGRKWNTMWIPVRSTIGIALMIPKASGYSVIQIFVMWVVVQGVGAADTLWNTTVRYIIGAGTMVQTPLNAQQVQAIVTAAIPLFQQQVCLAGFNKLHNAEHPNDAPIFYSSSYPQLTADKTNYTISVPDPNNTPNPGQYGQPNFCGTVTFNHSNYVSNPTLDQARVEATWQMILDLQSYAEQYVNNNGLISDQLAANQAIGDAVLDYIAIIDPALQKTNQTVNDATSTNLTNLTSYGWILAGTTYEMLAGLQGTRKVSNSDLPANQPQPLKPSDSINDQGLNSSDRSTLSSYVQSAAFNITNITNQITNQSVTPTPDLSAFSDSGSNASLANHLVQFFTLGLLNVYGYWQDAFTGNFSGHTAGAGVDPILSVTYLGNRIVDQVGKLWIAYALIMFGVGFASGILGCITAGISNAVSAMMNWFTPFATFIMVILFTAGSVMAYYVPIVPYVIFLFGSLGWILGVVESMVAAPIVALGVSHPDGQHEIWGKADPAVMLLTNIFLRPSLMIIGFIAAILVSYVGIDLLNLGFGKAVAGISTAGDGDYGNMFKGVAMVIIYTVLVMMIINRAYSLITEIPTKVLRWIGGQEQLGESSADLHQLQGAVSSTSNQVGGTISKGVGELAGSASKFGEKLGKQASNKMWDSGSLNL